jgi:hypothetical protein
MKNTIFYLLLIFTSCQSNEKNKVITESQDFNKPVEFYSDSINIGRKSYNKIELSLYKTDDSTFVIINFYSKQSGKWVLKTKFEFPKDGITGLDTKLSEFNNDNFNDMTYISAVAARGANEIRRLFLYDKDSDQLILLKNSEKYPNLRYNKELNCIDAFLVSGGCSTVFLTISKDSLKKNCKCLYI